jgi:hypothetical protein
MHLNNPNDPSMQYIVTFTINIPQMLAYIPYMDPMGIITTNIVLVINDIQW